MILLFVFIFIFLYCGTIVYKENQTKDISTLDKINKYNVLDKNYKTAEELNQRFDYLRELLNDMTIKEISKYHNEIWSMLSTTFNYEEGRNLAIEVYEKIIDGDVNLDKENRLLLNARLVPLYGTSNQYAKVLYSCMSAIDLSDDLKNNYFKAKLLIDMSNVFRILGKYEITNYTLKEALTIDIEEEFENSFIKIYGLLNLAEINYILNNNDDALNYAMQINDYIKNIHDEDRVDDYEIAKNIILSKLYTEMDDYDNANFYLKEAKLLLTHDKKTYLVDKDISYVIAYADLKTHSGIYDEAIELYENALNLSKERNNIEYLSTSLKNLSELYLKVNNQDKLKETKDELIDLLYREKELINEEYIGFAIAEYENDKIEKDNFKKSFISYIVIAVSTLILIIILIYIIILININRKDHLTKTYNRRYFDKVYNKLLNKKSYFSIIIFDIDNFKLINDNYGHDFGDQVLIQICKNIKSILNKSDKLFRYGGEEFVILSRSKEKDYIINFAESTRELVENIKWDKDITVTISMGVCDNSEENLDLIKVVDENLYISKTTGKNKVTISKTKVR